ncbi:hypothetical protein SKAU_G00179300 [Synaphobranchus kaupii]|uniref:protein-histidine N-methyltransferase n=1 Tax=Synaphobranchus kaupii TaxID=118154 RepID=A0A9Q1FM00_SYNKA|nr:hypothetical protein SKAU_G00179300 [Synaphobranchus kaupii]
MAFSFNFDLQIKTDEAIHKDSIQKDQDHEPKPIVTNDTKEKINSDGVKEAKEHSPPPDCQSLLEDAVRETFTLGTLPPIHYLNESVFEQTMSELLDSEDILSKTAAQNTDLISGVYEGGLKVWECTYDLLEHLEAEGEAFSGKRVLDLGCGAGLLGILALKRGAREVHFQDYNSTVIERVTLPNVLLNCEDDDDDDDDDDGAGEGDEEGVKYGCPPPKRRAPGPPRDTKLAKCRFFSGSWTSFLTEMLSNDPLPKYDLIMTSETIYNEAYYPALHEVFRKLLDQGGLVYLATKAHYFGVGGGLYLFQNFVEQRDVFKMKCLKNVEQGLQRHVVALSFKKPDQ